MKNLFLLLCSFILFGCSVRTLPHSPDNSEFNKYQITAISAFNELCQMVDNEKSNGSDSLLFMHENLMKSIHFKELIQDTAVIFLYFNPQDSIIDIPSNGVIKSNTKTKQMFAKIGKVMLDNSSEILESNCNNHLVTLDCIHYQFSPENINFSGWHYYEFTFTTRLKRISSHQNDLVAYSAANLFQVWVLKKYF